MSAEQWSRYDRVMFASRTEYHITTMQEHDYHTPPQWNQMVMQSRDNTTVKRQIRYVRMAYWIG